jgi:mannose-6-phosphate isomerase-like protein (cupin superfamily)
VIVEGTGLVEIDGMPAPQEVNAGDVVIIPPEVRQRIANTGSDDLVFLAICSPRFCQEMYEDMDS